MDEAHRAIALACTKQRVRLRALGHPADFTLSVGFVAVSLGVWDLMELLRLVKLLG